MELLASALVFAFASGLVLFAAFDRVFDTGAARAAARVLGPGNAMLKSDPRANMTAGAFGIGLRESDGTIAMRLRRAGLGWTPQRFWSFVAIPPVIVAIGIIVWLGNIIFAGLAGLAVTLAMPRIALVFLERRRIALFNKKLPSAVDVLIRGAKAGLPLNDCVRLVANESQEPIAGEFRTLMQDQAVGRTLAEAFRLMATRLNTPETHLLSTVVQIQTQTGGNIAEILSGFSQTLRGRNALRDKIRTITAESKISAYILTAMPFAAFKMIDGAFPDRTRLLFETGMGNIILISICAWMFIGLFIVFKLVNMKV